MNWILVVVIVWNGVQYTTEIKPLDYLACHVLAGSVTKKQATVNGEAVQIMSATCKDARNETPNQRTPSIIPSATAPRPS